MDRRSFVKATVLTASAGALAAGGIGLVRALIPTRDRPIPALRYFGAHKVAGPAPVGTPFIPIDVRDGAFVVKTDLSFGGRAIDVLAWHLSCGRADAPGLQPGWSGDDRLIYADKEEYRIFVRPWFAEKIGEPIRPEDFPDVDFGAAFAWRSQGRTEFDALPGVIVKIGRDALRAVEHPVEPAKALSARELEFVREEIMWGDFIAVSAVCTHFCCTAGYKEAEKLARARDAWDHLYCTCHSATFDLRAPVAYERAADPLSSA